MTIAWSRLSREQKRAWTVVAGVITAGTIIKVSYFKFSRGLMVADSKRQQEDAIKRLQEASDFARWSKQDRESRLPILTEEQRHQLREYLLLVEEHGMTKAFGDNSRQRQPASECIGCPILRRFEKSSDAK